jgi:hypothetical protein
MVGSNTTVAWMLVCCYCCVLSDRCLCYELTTRTQKFYRLCCVVLCDLTTSSMRRPWPSWGRNATEKKIIISLSPINFITNPLKLSHSAQSVQMTSQEIEGLIHISNKNNNFSMPQCTGPFWAHFICPVFTGTVFRKQIAGCVIFTSRLSLVKRLWLPTGRPFIVGLHEGVLKHWQSLSHGVMPVDTSPCCNA